FAVDGRKHFYPRLSNGFHGNVIFVATASSTVEQLLAGPIDRAVNIIQEAKCKITHQHMLSTVAWIASGKSPLEISPSFHRWDLMISSWQRLEMAGTDFGSGKPAFV
ncbi:hypothetical protein SELMODRAFT_69205, partial [Selaginella moellendorffii]